MTDAGVAVLVLDGPEEQVAATQDSFSAVAGPGDELHVCASWFQGAARASAPYCLLLRAGDRLEPGALRALEGFARARASDLVTADRIENGRIQRCPRFSLRLLEQFPYAGRAVLVSTDLLLHLAPAQAGQEGGGAEPRSEWDLQLRLVDAAEGGDHCPVVAFNQASPVRVGSLADRLAAVREHLERCARDAERVQPGPTGLPRVEPDQRTQHRVSVIVPTAFTRRDLADGSSRVLVEVLLAGLAETTAVAASSGQSNTGERAEEGAVDIEVVLVVDADAPAERIEACRSVWPGQMRIVRTQGPFNFSRAVNAGAAAARGDVLLLLNDDIEPVSRGWVHELLSVLDLPGVGAVGARLLFEDGRIQHLGVVCPPGLMPLHPRIFEPDLPAEPMAQADVDYLAVTGACLMYRRADHDAVGGWNEELPLNFNDVDFCLRLGATGRAVVCRNSVRLLHRESSTRTAEIIQAELEALEPWADYLVADPHIEYWG